MSEYDDELPEKKRKYYVNPMFAPDVCCEDYIFEVDHWCNDCGSEHCPENECPKLEK